MKKFNRILAVTLSAALPLASGIAYGESAVEEPETIAAEEQEEDSALRDFLFRLIDKGGEIAGDVFAKGGIIDNALPERAEIDSAVEGIKDRIDGADEGLKSAVDGLLSLLSDEKGSLNLDGILSEGSAGLDGLLDSISGALDEEGQGAQGLLDAFGSLFGEDRESELDALIAETEKQTALLKDCIREINAAELEDIGDVQIFTLTNIFNESDSEYRFCYSIQNNYTEDEEHQLHQLNEAKKLVLFTLQQTEDGLDVADAVVVGEDGDFDASLEEICTRLNVTADEYQFDIQFTEIYSVPDDLLEYMKDHPEITGIEFDGKIRDQEEIKAIREANLQTLLSELETDEALESEEASVPEM